MYEEARITKNLAEEREEVRKAMRTEREIEVSEWFKQAAAGLDISEKGLKKLTVRQIRQTVRQIRDCLRVWVLHRPKIVERSLGAASALLSPDPSLPGKGSVKRQIEAMNPECQKYKPPLRCDREILLTKEAFQFDQASDMNILSTPTTFHQLSI